ncbi:MAG: hypothetical protein AAF726_19175 [Planctomycetota bacterium]
MLSAHPLRPALVVLPALIVGCSSDDDDGSAGPPPALATVTIGTDRAIASSELLPDAGAGLAGTGVAPTMDGLDLDATPFAITRSVVATTPADVTPELPSADGSPTSSPDDAFSAFVANVAVEAQDFPDGMTLVTEALAPYATLATDVNGFTFDSSATTLVAGDLQIRVTTAEDDTIDVLSNVIPTRRYAIRQVTEEVTNTFQGGWVTYAGQLFFRALNNAAKDKGFALDDSVGTSRIQFDMNGSGSNEAILLFGEYFGKLYFRARSSAYPGRRLYWYDVDTDEVRPVSTITPGSDTAPTEVMAHGRSLYYVASVASGVRKILRYTETATGEPFALEQISDTAGTGVSDAPSNLTSFDGDIYFTGALSSGNRKLFRFDVGAGVLEQISDSAPGASDEPRDLTPAGGVLYLTLQSGSGASKLYRFDPLNSTLQRVANVSGSASTDDDPDSLVTDGTTLAFTAVDSTGSRKVYALDLAAGTLRQASDSAGMGASDDPEDLVAHAGEFFFSALNASGARKLFAFDPSTGQYRQVVDLTGNAALSDDVSKPMAYAGQLFFTGANASDATKLFAYEPATGRVTQVSDLTGDSTVGDDISLAIVYGDRLLFTGRSPGGDIELFRLCDQSMGCTD